MILLAISVTLVIVISAACSLTEAALYAVRRPYIRQLIESGSKAGSILEKLKQNMEQPITAILIVNTVANTAGAAVAGAQARSIFAGDTPILLFSAVFTLMVLFFSEIMPKIAGVAYNRVVARAACVPLSTVISALYPIVWLTQRVSRLLQRGEPALIAPEEEVQQMAMLSAEEGSILPVEAKFVQNVLRLDEVRAKDIMTPRTVVFAVPADLTVRQFTEKARDKLYSRVPLFAPDDPEQWVGVVRSQDILSRLAKDQFDVVLGEICRPVGFVSEFTDGYHLLTEFLTRKAHLLGVVNEYGSIVGIVTFEDIIESLIGAEIVDETDRITDLQAAARARAAKKFSPRNSGRQDPEIRK